MIESISTLLNSEAALTVLFWVITILVTGFIAQFGKQFATFLIDRIKRIKNRGISESQSGPSPPEHLSERQAVSGIAPGQIGTNPYNDAKATKKMLKALAKERKKK